MSLALIQESAKEVRRLGIAGSALAVGDFRLKKLIEPLEKAGEKVPVFAQVAKAISQLVHGQEKEAAANLLQLSTLVNAILYTQGQSGTPSELKELETTGTGWVTTRTSSRVLKPLIVALTTSGAGRAEIVKSAVERGAFNDLRLIGPALQALEDSFAEIADLIAEKVLPGYGPGILPRVRETFDPKGKTKSDARRLGVMHRIDPAGTKELCLAALDDGAQEVKIAAIRCLGSHEDCLPLLLEQTKAKNKAVRAAALEAVATQDHPETAKVFLSMIAGKIEDFVSTAFRALRSQAVLATLLAESRKVLEQVLKEKDASAPLVRLCAFLDALPQGKDAATEAFLIEAVAQAGRLVTVRANKNDTLDGGDVLERLAQLLYQLGSPAALKALTAQHGFLPPEAFKYALRGALRTWPADQFFVQFSPLLAQQKGAGKEKADQLRHVAWATTEREPDAFEVYETLEQESLRKLTWDPRWLDAAIKADNAFLVMCFARPNHQGAVDYLLKYTEPKKKPSQAGDLPLGFVIRALARCAYTGLADVFVELVTRRLKGTGAQRYDYDLQDLFENARHLPPSAIPQLEALAAKVDDHIVDRLLISIEALRQATKQPEA